MQVFTIENHDWDKLTIIIEPWAEAYYLKKGQKLELFQEEGLNGYYHQIAWKNGDIQIYVEADYNSPIVKLDGKDIDPFQDFI